MRCETLVARFWLRVHGVAMSPCRCESRDKRQGLWGRERVSNNTVWVMRMRGLLFASSSRLKSACYF